MANTVHAQKLVSRADAVATQADRAEAAGAPAHHVAVLRTRAAGMAQQAQGAASR